MPVAVSFGDDVTLHEDAEQWRYETVADNTVIIALLDDDSCVVETDLIAQNVCQITTLTREEYYEAAEMMQ